MITDLKGLPGPRLFLNVANERTCFASCACACVDHSFENALLTKKMSERRREVKHWSNFRRDHAVIIL